MGDATRSRGERIRLRHALDRHGQHLRALLCLVAESTEIPAPDVGQSIVMSALDVATTLARLGAYQRAEADK